MACNTAARQDWIERVAIGASLLCLVHCLALPIAIAMLPALATVIPIPEHAHVWLLGIVVPAAGFALLSGYRGHGDIRPSLAGAAGLVLLTLAALALPETVWDIPLTISGSAAVVFAHSLNWTLRHACRSTRDCQ